MLVAGPGEDYLLILAIVASDMHQYTSRITVGAIYMLNGIILLHCLNLQGAGKHRPRLLLRQK